MLTGNNERSGIKVQREGATQWMGKGLCHTLLTPSGITEPEPQHSATMNDDNNDVPARTLSMLFFRPRWTSLEDMTHFPGRQLTCVCVCVCVLQGSAFVFWDIYL